MEGTFRPDGVVVGLDSSDDSHQALRWAADYASGAGLPLHVVAAHSPQDAEGWDHDHADHRAATVRQDEMTHHALTRIRAEYPELQVSAASTRRLPAATLVRAGARSTLVVLGGHGEAVLRWALGSTAHQVAAYSPSSVAVVRGQAAADDTAPGRILVGVDAIAPSRQLDWALARAARSGAEVVALHAWQREDAPGDGLQETAAASALDTMVREQAARYPEVKVQADVAPGNPAKALVREAQDKDVIVVGARGQGGFDGLLLGHIAATVLYRAPCTVVIAR